MIKTTNTHIIDKFPEKFNDPAICPICGCHKSNYLEMMRRPCHEEHGIGSTKAN